MKIQVHIYITNVNTQIFVYIFLCDINIYSYLCISKTDKHLFFDLLNNQKPGRPGII